MKPAISDTPVRVSENYVIKLMVHQTAIPKTIVFCQLLQHCANIFTLIKQILGRNITEPSGVTGNLQTCLYSVCTTRCYWKNIAKLTQI